MKATRFTTQGRVWVLVTALLAGLVAGTGGAGAALADTLLVTAPWTRLRAEPAEKARVLNVVYGNDSYTVLETKDGWARIRTRDKTLGWLAAADFVVVPADGSGIPKLPAGSVAETPGPLPPIPTGPRQPIRGGTALDNAEALQRLGYSDDARRRLVNLVLVQPSSEQAYRATRDLLVYYPLGRLPAYEQANAQSRDAAKEMGAAVLLEEGSALTREKRYRDAVTLYESLLRQNAKDGRAYLSLLDTLNAYLSDAAKAPGLDDLNFAVAALRRNYPDQPLPQAVQTRLGGDSKSK